MKLVTPEKLLGKKEPKIKWHHGTCDMCKARNILVCHFGYNVQPRSYRVCKNCMFENLHNIVYGKEAYNDAHID